MSGGPFVSYEPAATQFVFELHATSANVSSVRSSFPGVGVAVLAQVLPFHVTAARCEAPALLPRPTAMQYESVGHATPLSVSTVKCVLVCG